MNKKFIGSVRYIAGVYYLFRVQVAPKDVNERYITTVHRIRQFGKRIGDPLDESLLPPEWMYIECNGIEVIIQGTSKDDQPKVMGNPYNDLQFGGYKEIDIPEGDIFYGGGS